jgi:hypothetical protein
MMAIDELIERGIESKTRRDDAGAELAAIVKALDGMAGVGMLDDEQKRSLSRLRGPRRKTARRRSTGKGRSS